MKLVKGSKWRLRLCIDKAKGRSLQLSYRLKKQQWPYRCKGVHEGNVLHGLMQLSTQQCGLLRLKSPFTQCPGYLIFFPLLCDILCMVIHWIKIKVDKVYCLFLEEFDLEDYIFKIQELIWAITIGLLQLK
jgi:hypothetical protein